MSATSPQGALALTLAGETLWLLPERAVFWPDRHCLLVADTHLGKGGAFRRAGLAIPTGDSARTLERLQALIACTGAKQVIILGDVLHAALPATDPLPEQLAAWRERQPEVAVAAIRGNHDRNPEALAGLLDWQPPGTLAGPFVLRHQPAADPRGPVLAGHVHPVVRLSGPARDQARLPAFVLEDGVLTLPAFGELTGGHPVSPAPGRRRYAVMPHRVAALDG